MTQVTLERRIGKNASDQRQGSVQRVLRNSALNLAGQGLYAAFYLVAIAALTRGLNKEAFGQYYTLFALMLVVQVVCEAGVSTVLTRRLARSPDNWRSIVGQAGGLFAGIALVSIGVFLGLGVLWNSLQGESPTLSSTPQGGSLGWGCFALTGLACAAIQVQRFCAAVFGAFELFAYENLARILQGATFAGLIGLVMVLESPNLLLVVGLLAASQVLGAVFLAVNLQRRLRGRLGNRKGTIGYLKPSYNEERTTNPEKIKVVRNWLAESVPLGLGDVLRGLCWQVDTLMLSLLQPAAVVGLYSVAYRPIGPINWIPLSILTAVFPSFARNGEDNRAGLQAMFSASIRLLWIASLPIGIFFCVAAERVIVLLAGPEYLEAALPMRVVIWITSLSFLSYPLRFLFTAIGKQRWYACLVLLVLSSQVVIGATLIPRLGYWGACTGSVLAESLFTVAGLTLCRFMGIRGIEWRSLVGAGLAGVCMAALLWPTRNFPLPLLALSALGTTGIYFLLCVLFGALRQEEVRRFGLVLGIGTRSQEPGTRNQNSRGRNPENKLEDRNYYFSWLLIPGS